MNNVQAIMRSCFSDFSGCCNGKYKNLLNGESLGIWVFNSYIIIQPHISGIKNTCLIFFYKFLSCHSKLLYRKQNSNITWLVSLMCSWRIRFRCLKLFLTESLTKLECLATKSMKKARKWGKAVIHRSKLNVISYLYRISYTLTINVLKYEKRAFQRQ